MLAKDLEWILNNTKLNKISFTLGNLPLHIFAIEEIKPEREMIKIIRQTKSHIILDEIYSPDKIGLAFYKNGIYRYLIRCIRRNNSSRNDDIIIILNSNFNRYYKLRRIDYETKWITLLYKLKDLELHSSQYLKLQNIQKLKNNVKKNYMILTECAKISGLTEYAAISNNIIGDQPILLYDKKSSLIINTGLIWKLFSLELDIEYSDDLQRKFEEIRAVQQKVFRLNIIIDDIYDLLIFNDIIDSI